MAYEDKKTGEQEEKTPSKKIYTDLKWDDKPDNRKLLSVERFGSNLVFKVSKWDDKEGRFSFNENTAVYFKWEEKSTILKELRNMVKIVKLAVTKKNAGEPLEGGKVVYESSVSTPTGEVVFTIKIDNEGEPIAGYVLNTTDGGSDFFVIEGSTRLKIRDNIDELVLECLPEGLESIHSVLDRIEDCCNMVSGYAYDASAEISFFGKGKNGQGQRKFNDSAKESDDFPF